MANLLMGRGEKGSAPREDGSPGVPWTWLRKPQLAMRKSGALGGAPGPGTLPEKQKDSQRASPPGSGSAASVTGGADRSKGNRGEEETKVMKGCRREERYPL